MQQRTLEAWASCGGTTAEAAKWALERIDALQRRNAELTRELEQLKSDARVGEYLLAVRTVPAAATQDAARADA